MRHYPQSFELSTLGGWIATRSGGHFATLYTHIDTDTSYRMSLPYPNPAHNQCTIDFNDVTEDIYLQLIDITGKIIQDYVVPAGSHQLNINTSNLPNGSYYYLLKDVEGQTKTGKIVVVHL